MQHVAPITQEGIDRETDFYHPTRCGRCGEALQVRVTDDGRFIVGCPTYGHEQLDIGQLDHSGEWVAEL